MKELPKIYEPQQVEGRIYQMWMDHDCFKAEPDPDKKPFSIVMPPPNVTGQLHMGHAMDSTLQDILTRFKRMQGYSALWLPGTDHAGIATQIKVEEELRTKEGLTRYDLGREKFLQRVWQWKEKYGNRIVEQQKKMGASCDWSRSRFTMDEGCSKAVRETFCELYDKGLIYKGSRIINWCPHCLTALSDGVSEPVFSLDVEAAGRRADWFDKDLFRPQPFMKFGVATDAGFRALRGGRPVENMRVAGAILSGADSVAEGSGAGVALATAMAAANAILKD
mgnify:CR=1 FL=1